MQRKFISWNVNGLRACQGKGFSEIFQEMDADFFCLQETKMQAGQLDLQFPGYQSFWNYADKKGYSGTACFTKQEISIFDKKIPVPIIRRIEHLRIDDIDGIKAKLQLLDDGDTIKITFISSDGRPDIHYTDMLYSEEAEQKFFGNAKIALVAAMHDELHISRAVNHIHGFFHFVVSTLRIGDKGEANGVASLANALYVGNIFGVEVVWPVDVGTVGNVLKIRTTSHPYTHPEP